MNALYGVNEFDNDALRTASWSLLNSLAPNEEIGRWNSRKPSQHEMNDNWFKKRDSRKVLILGDSLSKDIFNALFLNPEMFDGVEVARFALGRNFPPKQIGFLLRTPNFENSDIVVISVRYDKAYLSRIPAFVEKLHLQGKEVVIVGNTAEYDSPGRLPIFDLFLRRSGSNTDLTQINSVSYENERTKVHAINKKLREIARETGARYLSRRDLICSDENLTCTLVTPNGRKAFYDNGHWTLEGARYFGALAANAGWFR